MHENVGPGHLDPVIDQSGVHQAGVDGAGAGWPGIDQPAVRQPVVDGPGVGEPVVDQSGVRPAGVDGAGVGQPVVDGPGVGRPVVDRSGVQPAGVGQAGVRQSVVDQAGADQSVVHGPGVHESGVHKVGVGGHESGDQAVGNQDCVVLDIGGEVGALILYAPAELSGAEVEISLPGAGPRTHSIVRERRVDQNAAGRHQPGRHAAPSGPGDTAVYAAVYPGLRAGIYTIWRDAQTPAGTVKIEGGQVASWLWE
jgi:hypothetical protein